MKPNGTQARLLRTALRGRSRRQLKRLFALIRAHDDGALLETLAAPPKRADRRAADPLLRDLQQMLKPILGSASEKASLLVEHIARTHRRKLSFEAKGLADATRQLRTAFSDDEIRDGARTLMRDLAELHGGRDTVV